MFLLFSFFFISFAPFSRKRLQERVTNPGNRVEIISDLIARSEKSTLVNGTAQINGVNGTNGVHTNGNKPKRGVIEAEREAEDKWTQRCEELCAPSLFRKVDSWVFGRNVPGKKKAVMFYFGGLGPYIKEASGLVEDNMKGFRIS